MDKKLEVGYITQTTRSVEPALNKPPVIAVYVRVDGRVRNPAYGDYALRDPPPHIVFGLKVTHYQAVKIMAIISIDNGHNRS